MVIYKVLPRKTDSDTLWKRLWKVTIVGSNHSNHDKQTVVPAAGFSPLASMDPWCINQKLASSKNFDNEETDNTPQRERPQCIMTEIKDAFPAATGEPYTGYKPMK
ncbi:hypothetical protein G9A89_000726 [Geosiphon pyriformis]|nr:hypothetical protein G9A89_000726 [Geosiphon pyriformis]